MTMNEYINVNEGFLNTTDYRTDHQSEQECLEIAIQTVLHNHKNRIHLLMNSRQHSMFIKELSEEILRRANTYKHLTNLEPNLD